MEIEELFCKRYPEYSVNGKPLHPYFDIFEEGYEQAEKENEELRSNGFTVSAMTEQQLKVAIEKGEQLEKENAELKGIKDVATLIKANNDTVVTLMQLNNKLVSKSQQLTKAKDLIHQFLIQNPISDWLPKKAEQFLKEGEECRLQKQLMKNTKN